MHDVQHISVRIVRPPAEVYEFASDPRDLPRPGMSDGQLAKDGAAVENDLKTLKDLLERKSSS